MKSFFQRRNFFINKDLQGKLIYHSFLLAFGGVIVFTLIFCLLSANNLTLSYQDQHLQIGRTPIVLLQEILTAHWVFLLSVGLFIVINSLFLSHRIAGPLYRLQLAFTAMENKDLNQDIHLRTKDLGKELTNQLNHVNTLLSADLRQMQQLCEEMEQVIEKQEEKNDSEELAVHRQKLLALKKILSAYRLRPEAK